MKKILTVDELIAHMKEKGITFEHCSETQAKDFLTHNNYYMKLAAYRTNYPKYPADSKLAGKYIKLDFAYLQELSKIDMLLRYIIVEMCLDIEHSIKVKLVNDITASDDDGYEIVRKFLAQDKDFRILKNIRGHKAGEYCKDLIAKYYPYFPLWVFVELITFGDLLYLCSFYDKERHKKFFDNKLMNIVRDMRNAAAHSNCMLNKIAEKQEPSKQADIKITTFVQGITTISRSARLKHLKAKFTYNFTVLLYVYDALVAKRPRQKRYKQLLDFMQSRAIRHKEYFTTNENLTETYNFFKNILDFLQSQSI